MKDAHRLKPEIRYELCDPRRYYSNTLNIPRVLTVTSQRPFRFYTSLAVRDSGSLPARRSPIVFGGEVKNVIRVFAVILGLMLIVAVCAYAAETAPGTVVLKGAPMGGVKFDHKAHAAVAGKCDACHHASKPAKALASAHQKCQDCHTTPATAPVTTKTQLAFHNATATGGTCIDCHKTQNAAGKKAPTKCAECHQKANA